MEKLPEHEQPVNIDIQRYHEAGGILNDGTTKIAINILSELANGEPRKVGRLSLLQADNMESVSKVTIKPEQKYLYAALRDITTRASDCLNGDSETMSACDLSDQRLLAEVIKLTGGSNLDAFLRSYPNIFELTK